MMRPWRRCFYVQDYCVYLSVCGSRPHQPHGDDIWGTSRSGGKVDVPWAYSQKWKVETAHVQLSKSLVSHAQPLISAHERREEREEN